ncbi:MAG: helicase HerA-like domain-containing protein [Rhodocyclaceae bacterium]
MSEPMLIARTLDKSLHLLPRRANRHGLITGATGTGKTVTLQKMAEAFANAGVPVFVSDIKGDLSGIAAPGTGSARLLERLAAIGIDHYEPRGNSTVFWDVYGEQGHPVRATISDMGPLLLARLLNLNDTQTGVLQLVFKIADDNGLLLLDLKDLRAMVQFVGENAKSFTTEYGNISAASVGAIQRNLLGLEEQGAEHFFGEPMLDLADLMQTDANGRGVINILAAEKLYHSPRLYSTFLLWMLAELFEQLPEVGDPDKPRLVFFFDEAHLLFNDAPKALIEKVEHVVRLIRSKGVGVYFITQSPADVPDTVLGQLGNRVQHALRAFTPRDQRAVRSAAETMRPNPAFSAAEAITELGVGEALVSFLDAQGRPEVVERAFIVAPDSRMGPLTPDERQHIIRQSVLYGHYEQTLDRESAYELLRAQADAATARAAEEALRKQAAQAAREAEAAARNAPAAAGNPVSDLLFGSTGPRGGRRDGLVQTAAKTITRTIGSSIGRQIVRGLLGSLLGGGGKR